MNKGNYVVTLVCGIIGGVLSLLGSACISICASTAAALDTSISASFYIFGYGGMVAAVVGLVCGCMAAKSSKASVVMLVCAVFFVASLIFLGFSFTTLIGCVLFAVGGIFGIKAGKAE